MNNLFTKNCKPNHLNAPSVYNYHNHSTFSRNRNQPSFEQEERERNDNASGAFQNDQQQKLKQETFQILNDLQLKHIFEYIKKKHLKEFLLTLTSAELRQAARKKQQKEDAQFEKNRQSKNNKQQLNKKNILDLTVFQVYKRWHDTNSFFQKLSYDFQKVKMTNGIKDHPKYGMKILQREPDKYYLGKRSQHYNHAKEIEEAYRQLGYLSYFPQNDSEQQQENNQQDGNQDQNNNYEDESDQMQDFIEDDDAPIQYQVQRRSKKKKKQLKKCEKKINSKKNRNQDQQKDEIYESNQQQLEQSQNAIKKYLIEQSINDHQQFDKSKDIEKNQQEQENDFRNVNLIKKKQQTQVKTRKKMEIDLE